MNLVSRWPEYRILCSDPTADLTLTCPLNRDRFQSGQLWYWFQRRRQFMPRKRFKTEEIIQKLREVEVLLSQGE